MAEELNAADDWRKLGTAARPSRRSRKEKGALEKKRTALVRQNLSPLPHYPLLYFFTALPRLVYCGELDARSDGGMPGAGISIREEQ